MFGWSVRAWFVVDDSFERFADEPFEPIKPS